MGLCKCRKVTDLYCFVHKKPVCDSCICTDHKVCMIGTYVQWLQDPDYDKPVCEICKEELTAANVIRLLCFHMMHPECLDLHASSFPPNTAQAGFTCPHPNCKTPIVPTGRPGNSTLAYLLYRHLENAPWLDSKSLPENHDEGPFSGDTVVIDLSSVNAVPSNEANGDSKSVKQSTKDSKLPAVHVIDMPGIASRKIQRTSSPLISAQPENPPELHIYDDDEDKYNKHYVARLLNDSPPVTASTQGVTKKSARPVRLTLKKLLIGFALISTLLIVILLSTSLE